MIKSTSHIKLFIINCIFSLLCYITLISQNLTNTYDGLWHSPYFISGSWELSIGRWAWPILDRLRCGYSTDPINSYLTLAFFAAGNVLLFDIFYIVDSKKTYLYSAMILSSTTVCCFLSYNYMSPTFGAAYALSISATWFLVRFNQKPIYSILISAIFICFSLGMYQANIGCTCLVMLTYIIVLCMRAQRTNCIKFISHCICSVVLGCASYKILWDIILKTLDINAASYNSADNISVKTILLNLPENVIKTYSKFYLYFWRTPLKHNLFQATLLFKIILILLVLIFLFGTLRLAKRDIICAMILLITTAIIPIACNICFILAPDSSFLIQETMGMSILIPLLFTIIELAFNESEIFSKNIRKNYKTSFLLTLSVILLYGNIYATATDIDAMKEGKTASETLANYIINTLIDENLYNIEQSYVFIGRPSDNVTFDVSPLFKNANVYAQFGSFDSSASSIRQSYDGLFTRMGINLKVAENNIIEEYCELSEVQKMPCYPEDGSIQLIKDYVVIKVSDINLKTGAIQLSN